MASPNWTSPFDVIYDASDCNIRALGQKRYKIFRVICYASKTLNEGQENYTTIEKEMLSIVCDFDKF